MSATADYHPVLRTELLAALDLLAPQIEGLHDLTRSGLSEDTTRMIERALDGRRERKGLIMDVLAAMDAAAEKIKLLHASGYPSFIQFTVTDAQRSELEQQEKMISIAVAIFVNNPRATNIHLALGETTSKPL